MAVALGGLLIGAEAVLPHLCPQSGTGNRCNLPRRRTCRLACFGCRGTRSIKTTLRDGFDHKKPRMQNALLSKREANHIFKTWLRISRSLAAKYSSMPWAPRGAAESIGEAVARRHALGREQ